MFRAPASSPKHSPCATFMQPFQCNLPPQLQETHRTTHTGTTTRCKTHRRNHFATETTPAATGAHTRYLSSPAATTLYGKTQGFVLRLPPQNIAHATSCSQYNAVRSINSQTWTYPRPEQDQNSRWQESCSHSNAICNRRFHNTL